MAYIDKINKNNTDYDLQDSKAARSVNGTTDSHVEQADEIYTTSTQVSTSAFAYRTTAGDVSIETGAASINYLEGNTVQTGHMDEVLDVSGSFSDGNTSVDITAATWRSYVADNGTYTFIYNGTGWELNSTVVTLADYGLVVTGTVTEGDIITVNYVKLVIGTLATTTPVNFVSTGFNQYDATAGYAHVVGNNQYRIAGTYTSLGFTTTIGGVTTSVTVTDNKFTPAEDGYIYVAGASGDILIALVWSGTMDSEPYSAYSTSTIAIPTADANSTALPTASYGMPSVGNVRDELSFAEKTYIQKIGHYAYSAENLATVQALGVAYVYDLSDIFYVLLEPVTYTLDSSVSGAYTANDYGTEEFTGTTVPVNVSITYGNSLVDKLRNMLPIQSIGAGLTLTGTELSADGGEGGGMTTLTAEDYDYPDNNPIGIALWRLKPGWYQLDTSGGYLTYYTSSRQSQTATTCNTFLVLGQINSSVVILGFASQYNYATTFAHIWRTRDTGAGQTTDSSALAVLNDIYADPSTKYKIKIGGGSNAAGDNAVAIGYGAQINSANGSVALGYNANVGPGHYWSVALGASSSTTSNGEVSFGGQSLAGIGYNNSNYRLLTNVYDGQSAHDAATYGQLSTAIINGGTAAPTTATVGAVGTLYSAVVSNTAHLYACTAIDDTTDPQNPSYTWTPLV